MRRRLAHTAALVGALLLAWPSQAGAADCTRTSTGLVALPDLASGTYEGASGGLYPGGVNEPPAGYARAGLSAAGAVVPRDVQGSPDPNGKVVLLSIGMSNTTQEFAAFLPLARADSRRDTHVVVVDGAQGGRDVQAWAEPAAQTWSVVEQRLAAAGGSAPQVQAVWLKQAIATPRNDFRAYVRDLASGLRAVIDIAARRYPNLQQVFLSPRTYGGYATTALNPEPYAYWSGFAMRALVEESIAKPDVRPWIGWGPYLWTDGTRGRGDGLVWTCDDVQSDGTHPSAAGRKKVADLLQHFFDDSRFAGWYRVAAGQPVPSAAQRAASPDPSPGATSTPSATDDTEAPGEPTSPLLPVAAVFALGGLGTAAVLLWALLKR